MRARCFCGVALFAATAVALLLPVHADDAEPNFSGVVLPKREKTTGYLQALEERIERGEEKWYSIVGDIQWLISLEKDSVVEVTRQVGDVKIRRTVGLADEGRRLLAALPDKGLDAYEVRFGQDAAKLVSQARADGDAAKLFEVVRIYDRTKAGLDALQWLGTHYLERGNNELALVCFERHLAREAPAKVRSMTLFKAAHAMARLPTRCNSGNDSKLAPNRAAFSSTTPAG